jgi:hypothetical protein
VCISSYSPVLECGVSSATPFVLFGPDPGTPPPEGLPAGDEPSVERLLAELREAMRLMHGRPVGTLPLVLFYSTIDTFAWLELPPSQKMVTATAFCSWVERYMQPGTRLGCTSVEVYAARCAVVHTRTSHNPKEKPGVRKIWYSNTTAALPALRQHIAANNARAVGVSGAALYESLEAGARAFDADVRADANRSASLRDRLGLVLAPARDQHLKT